MLISRTLLKVFLIGLIMPATLQSKELQSLEAIAEGSNKFAFDLYEALKSRPGNLVVSPISAQIVLTLAYTGAGGSTAEDMAKVLHLPSNRDQVLEGHKALLTGLEDPVLKLATKMFIAKDYKVKPEFTAISNTYFLSGLEEKDFAHQSSQAREQINSWVEGKTNNKIKNLLPNGSVSSDTRIILVNAIHFKAKWKHTFNPRHTSEAPFYITPNETVNVQMMRLDNKNFKYAESDSLNAKILELPYEGNEFSMIIILPNQIDGLPEVESKLSTINLGDELSKLSQTPVNVQLPRFKIESDLKLNDPLIGMGMASAFSNTANFSGITNEPIKIDAVLQKAFIEVNEEGTEAAAATGVQLRARCLIIPIEVTVDHPFLVIIHAPDLKHILFMAAVKTLASE